MPSTASKEEKQETVVECEQNSSKIAVTGRNKRSDKSSTKSCDKEIAPRRHGEKFDSRSSTKKGDREDAGNYRPICSLLILYKLFATILYARLAPSLHKVQPADQGGFRPNHQTVDH